MLRRGSGSFGRSVAASRILSLGNPWLRLAEHRLELSAELLTQPALLNQMAGLDGVPN